MASVSIPIAFLAGLVSFLSPCVLPLIPGYIAYLAGTSIEDAETHRGDTFRNAAFFVLGFTLVFAAVGVLLTTLLSNVAYTVQQWLSRVGGAVVIFFGLYLADLINVSFLEKTHRIDLSQYTFPSRYLTSAVFGAAFAVGWTPCVGAALGAILGLAASQPGMGFTLLITYAAGLGLPFLLTGLFIHEAATFFREHAGAFTYIRRGFGVLLIVVGVLVFTQDLARAAYLGPVASLLGSGVP